MGMVISQIATAVPEMDVSGHKVDGTCPYLNDLPVRDSVQYVYRHEAISERQ